MELFKHTVQIAHIMDTPNIRMFSFYGLVNCPVLFPAYTFPWTISLSSIGSRGVKDTPGTNRLEIMLEMGKLVCENNKLLLYRPSRPQHHSSSEYDTSP